MNTQLLHGDCLDRLKELPDCSVDAIVTDPPYGLSFMGKKWDYDVPSEDVWRECLRVLKPGGHLLAFAGTRTQHRMAVRIEDAGFEIRDMIAWVYGSGFPKSLDVSKAIDKAAGAEREVVGVNPNHRAVSGVGYKGVYAGGNTGTANITAPATEVARQWQGWGTALKPALEPITVARKPLVGTVAANVLEHGTGAINVDGCRVEALDGYVENAVTQGVGTAQTSYNPRRERRTFEPSQAGRWPANLIHDGSDEVVGLFPQSAANVGTYRREQGQDEGGVRFSGHQQRGHTVGFGDSGSAARFFYQAKCSKKDRNEGLDSIRTVKHTTGLCKSENTELAELLQKATSASIVRWGIDESGASITGLCQSDSLSTTLTEISKITTSQICNLWTRSHTSESTVDAKCEMENGGSPAVSAEKSSQSPATTTNESQAESALGAKSVVSKMLSEISNEENWKHGSNFHATVKPTALMRYLCRLITPPGGIVLDPFTGSGSTGKAAMLEGFRFIGIEREAEYLEIARARIEHAAKSGDQQLDMPGMV